MDYPIRIGPDCYGKALLDVEGVFLVVRWVRDLEDVEPRIRNLSLSLGRFAVRLGNRWLRGEHL